MSTPTTDADGFQVVSELPAAKKQSTPKLLSNRQRLFRFLIGHPNQWVAAKTDPVGGSGGGNLYEAAHSLRGYGLDAEIRSVDGRGVLYVRLPVNTNGGEPQ